MTHGSEDVRLKRLRRWKRTGALVALAGCASAGLLAAAQPPRKPEGVVGPAFAGMPRPGSPDPLAPPAPPRIQPAAAPASPLEGLARAASAPLVPASRRLKIRVVTTGAPEADVLVRLVQHTRGEGTTHGLGPSARTDVDGIAELVLPEDLPGEASVELAKSDTKGYRHTFVPLDVVLAAATTPAQVVLPRGGSLVVRIEGLPSELRPASVDVRFVPPYGDSLSLFSGLRALPSEDGSLFEDRTVPRSHRLPFTAAGTATLARAPDDHALCVDVPNPPDGWIVECASCSGPHVVAREGEVLRVPEGVLCTLDIRFREAPRVRARVRTPEGAPIAGAEVRFGMSTGDEGVRLFNASGTTDAQGEVSVVLWTGSRLPDWTPDRLVAVAYLPGRRAAVVEAPGAWYGTELPVVLGPERGGSTGIDGVLTMPGGRPATGIPLRLTSGTTWNGHVGLPVQRAMTDAEGRFHFTVPDDLLEVLDRGGSGLAVRVDAELLEDAPLDALWRRKLRNLPLGVLVPEQVGAGGRPQRLEARLEVPP